jgi:hypothetical protein
MAMGMLTHNGPQCLALVVGHDPQLVFYFFFLKKIYIFQTILEILTSLNHNSDEIEKRKLLG